MKRLGTLTAALVILMAGFMSVCAADENCNPEATHTSAHGTTDLQVYETTQDHCGMVCHVASHTILPNMAKAFSSADLGQGLILSTDDTIRLGLYTVLDQPPRA